jgi:hypothetical protein
MRAWHVWTWYEGIAWCVWGSPRCTCVYAIALGGRNNDADMRSAMAWSLKIMMFVKTVGKVKPVMLTDLECVSACVLQVWSAGHACVQHTHAPWPTGAQAVR